MNRIEALQLIKKNRDSINLHAARRDEEINKELNDSVKKLKQRFIDIIETARLCEAGEHHSLQRIKRFKSTRSPGLKFASNAESLLFLTDIDEKLAVMRIDKDGTYSFFFSGSLTTDPSPSTAQESEIIMLFLKKYDRFEKRFYSFVDRRLKREASHLKYLNNKFKNNNKD